MIGMSKPKPIKVKISDSLLGKSNILFRQTPGFLGKWENITCVNSDFDGPVDWWVVLHASALDQPQSSLCDPNNIVFVTMEPAVWGRPDQFLSQFPVVISADKSISSANLYNFNGHTWWSGLNIDGNNPIGVSLEPGKDFDFYLTQDPPVKKNLISLISSGKRQFPGHKKRMDFIDKLNSSWLSNYIDFFGFDSNPISDKSLGLYDYKYHICLENSRERNYWTEKLADPFLNFCYPIYYGCPNISDYFDHRSMATFDVNDFNNFLSLVERILEEDRWTNSVDRIIHSRKKVLFDFNLFNIINKICASPASNFQNCTLQPMRSFKRDRSFVSRARHMLRRNFIL